MITLTRNQARRLRAAFRRSALGIAHRGPIPPIVFLAEGDRLLVRHRYAHLAVEHASPLAWSSSGSVALPLEALAELEGGDDSTVAFDPTGPDRRPLVRPGHPPGPRALRFTARLDRPAPHNSRVLDRAPARVARRPGRGDRLRRR